MEWSNDDLDWARRTVLAMLRRVRLLIWCGVDPL